MPAKSDQPTPAQKRVLETILAILEETNLPPLLDDIGGRLGITKNTVKEHVQHLQRKGWVSWQPGKIRSLQVIRRLEDELSPAVGVPIVGTVAAGYPILSPENIRDTVFIDPKIARRGQHFAVDVRGDSMRDADIRDGDIAIVRQQPTAEHGEIVVALVDGDATVKRLFKKGNKVELLPANPEFKPIPITRGDLQILGKVVAINRLI